MKMSWEDFCHRAKKYGYYAGPWENCISKNGYGFYRDGSVVRGMHIFARDVQYNKMLMIMRGLE